MAENLPINIPDKIDSPDRQALIAAYGSQYFLSADEFNRFKAGVNALYQVFIDHGGTVAAATGLIKGILKLAGDFGGTADEPRLKKILDLAVANAPKRLVSVVADGSLQAEEIMVFEVIDNTTSGFSSLSALSSAYPASSGLKKGFTVVCPLMAQPTVYKKCSDGDDTWLKWNAVKVT